MIFKCKICGGALDLDGALSVAVCTYCGTKQTLPKLDNARRASLYDRANHFRRNNDFDKATGIYEIILNDDGTDAEAYWSIVLCRYGIEYVEDPATHKRVPTVNRAQYTSIFDDEDYKSALKYADAEQRAIYEAEAKEINEIQRRILVISQKEEPFDVFLCCKETDADGKRTPDSVLAAEIYHELTAQGLKVFYSRITLENKLGAAYEPYIFAALHSAKVMVALGTKPEYFNAVWVKNEWSRFLALIKNGAEKTLIPAYRDMDPYALPDEFSHLQAQDMSKLGFLQDLARGIRKILDVPTREKAPVRETVVVAPTAIEPLFKRGEMALSDGAFDRADAFFEQVLNQDPENADAYVGKLLAALHLKQRGELKNATVSFENNDAYRKAIRFGDDNLKAELAEALRSVRGGIEDRKKQEVYDRATVLFVRGKDIPTCREAKALFQSIAGYRDAEKCVALCDGKIDELKAEWEKLRAEKREAAQARKQKAKKTRKRALIVTVSVLVAAAVIVPSCLYIFGVAVPNAKYEDALELIEEKKYDEAEALLNEAWRLALLDETLDKLDRAFDAIDEAKEADEAEAKAKDEAEKALEEARKADERAQQTRDQAIAKDLTELATANCEKAIRSLLGADVGVQIVYQCDGGTLSADPSSSEYVAAYASSSDFSSLPTPSREGYRFLNWSCEESDYQAGTREARLTLKAHWALAEYQIRYNLDGGKATNPGKYKYEDEAFTLTNPTKTGYTFLGWTGTGISGRSDTVTVAKGSSGDRAYTALWEANRYRVTFDTAGGSLSSTQATYTYGKTATLPTPTRSAYTFNGWYRGTTKVTSGLWETTSDVTLTAKWTPTTYTISYNLGKVPATNSNKAAYNVETPTFSLNAPSCDGCTFDGWYTEAGFVNKVTSIPKGSKGNVTLYAKWTIHTYSIEYDWHGGEAVDSPVVSYTVLDLPITLCAPQKENYKYYYWAQDEYDGAPLTKITTCADYHLVANYLPQGNVTVRTVSGGLHPSSFVEFLYLGTGNETELEIPKYTSYGSPIEQLSIIGTPNLTSVSFSDAVTELNIKDLSLGFTLQEYENGLYLGSRNNPYHSLVFRADPDLPLTTIHEDTVFIGSNPFNNDCTLQSIVIPPSVKIAGNAFSNCPRLVEIYDLTPDGLRFAGAEWNVTRRIIYRSLADERMVEYLTVDDFEFVHYLTFENNTYSYSLIRYFGTSPVVSLPETVDGFGSYQIGAAAFKDMGIIRIVIPNSVKKICNHAFDGCDKLLEIYNFSSLNITANASSPGGVGAYATAIHTSQLDPSIFTKQGDYYFLYDNLLDQYKLFAYAGNSTDLVLPDNFSGNTYRIAKDAFKGKTDVERVTISAGVVQIDAGAFENCTNLTEAVFQVPAGWKRNVDGSADPVVYDSAVLGDPASAATVLKELTSDLKPMVRANEP